MTALPVIAYIRVASPEPRSTGAARQRERITQWADQTGHTIGEWVEEAGHAGPAFDQAVARSRGKLIVAVSPERISRDPQAFNTAAEKVRAAGGQLGFVEGWTETSWQEQVDALLDEHDTATRTARASTYRRHTSGSPDQAGPQQQAAAVRAEVEKLGIQVQWKET